MKKFIVNFDETIQAALEKISLNSHRTVLVQKEEKIIGVLSGGDVAKIILKKIDLNTRVIKVTNKSFKFLITEDKKEARKIFKKYLIGLIPILNKKMQLQKIYLIKDFL